MKKISFLTIFVLLFTSINGQTMDTLATNNKLSYKPFIVPAVFITSGALLLHSRLNTDLQDNSRKLFGENFYTPIDNITPLIPIVQIYTGKYLGFTPKNNFKHQTVDIVVANTITAVIIQVSKNLIKEQRPDASNNLSFPSGHSGIAFTNAALLFQEYKDSNIWYASSGFLFATATGILRIANNKHYASDVLTGAGIGLASGIFISYYNPFQSINLGKNKKTTALIYPQLGNQIGLGAIIHPNF
jgi:membrane-associated phospholipid phosphatase